MKELEHIIILIDRIEEGIATPQDIAEVAAWMKDHLSREELPVLAAHYEKHEIQYPEWLNDPDAWQPMLSAILEMDKPLSSPQPARSKPLLRYWYRWVAAAVFILITGIVLYRAPHDKNAVPKAHDLVVDIVAPDSNHAVITLNDGRVVALDSINNGQLALQDNVKLVKLANGRIQYVNVKTGNANPDTEKYNTLSNPRGSKVVDMQFSDGSHVWLNAGSSITFPVAFVGDERKVQLKGEAYFEVAKDKTRKFIVSSEGVTTEVLGTHFNVNAYDEESATKITLLEGSVKVSSFQPGLYATRAAENARTLKPGQQAAMEHGRLHINYNPDLEEVMAWKNGLFKFNGTDMETLVHQLSIWYAVDISYQGAANKKVSGYISRSAKLTEVLEMLKYTAGINYKIEQKNIIIQ